jgi:glycosyltransferase involved in cell wall biosynthesis
MKAPLISIITPCFNSQEYLDKMISSVILQTYKKWELIIVDDCSTDKSLRVINDYLGQDLRIRVIKLSKNLGAARARNRGINLAKGRYLTFLDADDYWGINFLKYSLKCIGNKKFIYSKYNMVTKDCKYLCNSKVITQVDKVKLLKGCTISCLTAFIDTREIGKKYFPTQAFREDLAYWILLLKDIKFAYGYNFCEANYRLHYNSSSSNKLKMSLLTLHDYLNYYKLPIIKAAFYYVNYMINGFLKFFSSRF